MTRTSFHHAGKAWRLGKAGGGVGCPAGLDVLDDRRCLLMLKTPSRRLDHVRLWAGIVPAERRGPPALRLVGWWDITIAIVCVCVGVCWKRKAVVLLSVWPRVV